MYKPTYGIIYNCLTLVALSFTMCKFVPITLANTVFPKSHTLSPFD